MLETWNYKIFDKADNTLDVYLDGDIVDAATEALFKEWFGDDGSVSYRTFRNQVLEKSPKVLNVYINSYGGMVYDALAMHDFMNELRGNGVKVTSKIRGIAASAATFPALAADEVEMSENSYFMIHNASGAIRGDVKTVENYAKTMRRLNDGIVSMYSSRTGLPTDKVQEMMDKETHLTAQEAKEMGFIDRITGAATFKNAISPEQWAFKDRAILNSYNSQVKTEDMTIEQIKNAVTEAVKSLGLAKEGNKDNSEELVNQVIEKVTPQFQAENTRLENELQAEKDAHQVDKDKVADLEQKVANQGKQIVSLQASISDPAPDGDPNPDGVQLTASQKADLELHNYMMQQIGQPAITEAQFIQMLTPQKTEK